MKQLFFPVIIFLMQVTTASAQNVGIGTTSPNSKAILDVKSTTQGILFPRLNYTQRGALTNPPNGLHIYNTDENCLNYYDSTNKIWNCYCDNCRTIVINITSSACKVDFYNSYGRYFPARRYLINISAGVVISGCNPGDTALSFSSMPFTSAISINNHGIIAGGGGKGGNAQVVGGGQCTFTTPAFYGAGGGPAVSVNALVTVGIDNYDIVAGGGGGGGGGARVTGSGYGGGGGGGAGYVAGSGGLAGGAYSLSGTICVINYAANPGAAGTNSAGGAGGAGTTTGSGAGGNGGDLGTDGYSSAGNGGAGGAAITGGSGQSDSINNIGSGQSFGTVD